MYNLILNIFNGIVVEGTLEDDFILSLGADVEMAGNAGDDLLVANFGDNIVVGDTRFEGDFEFISLPDIYGFPLVIVTPPSVTTIGSDIIFTGSGDDIIYGDSGPVVSGIDFSTVTATAGLESLLSFTLKGAAQYWGNDVIYSGAGNDTISGDDGTSLLVPVDTDGNEAIANGTDAIATAHFGLEENLFVFGDDLVYSGAGDDFIHGDTNSRNVSEPGGGVATASNGGIAISTFSHLEDIVFFGNDTLYGGNGDDFVYGEGAFNQHTVFGGMATASSSSTASTSAYFKDLTLTFGDDYVDGERGNDTVYGDLFRYDNTIIGGEATATGGSTASSSYIIDGTTIYYGADVVKGGRGNDDVFGDVRFTSLNVVDGIATEGDATDSAEVITEMKNFSQILGNDLVYGGEGNDAIYGDLKGYDLVDDDYSQAVIDISGIDYVRVYDGFNNSITWGNDVLEGGKGEDVFFFSLLSNEDGIGTEGYDTITDFNLKHDSLEFITTGDPVSAADLSLVNSGGDTTIVFDLGSITLENVEVTNLDDLNITGLIV